MSDATSKLTRGLYRRGKTYWLNFQKDGKRRFITLETDDPLEAVRRASEMRAFEFPDQPTAMSRAIDDYLAEKRRLNIYSKATARVHGAALREFAERVEGRPLDAISERLAGEHYAALQARASETTAQIHMRALRAFFNWCVSEKLCRVSPLKGVRLAKIDQPARVKFCTKVERDALLKAATTDDLRFILLCGFDGGMRKNEIIEARVGWFDLKGGAVHLQNTPTFRLKDREARTVPITKRFATFLRKYLKGRAAGDFALRPEVKHGKGTYRYDFHRPYNDFMVAQEMRWVTAHVMRHTFASLLVQAGVSIYKVARWMGDGVAVVEKHYGHLAPKDADIERAR
jgi:integrase